MPFNDEEMAQLTDLRKFRDDDPDRFQAILDGYFKQVKIPNRFNVSARDALENEKFLRSDQGRSFLQCLRNVIAGKDDPYREAARWASVPSQP